MNGSESFNHDEKEFEIRTAQIGNKWCVKVFLDSVQVSPEYSVDLETHADYFAQYHENVIENLKSFAKSDIMQGMYFKA